MSLLFRCLARLPLGLMQALGGCLGWCVWALSSSYRRQFQRQVALSGVDPARARAAIAGAGRMVAELPWVWARPPGVSVLSRVDWRGEAHLHTALSAGRGVVLLSPHLGSWEIGAQALAEAFGALRGEWVVLYRPPRKRWLQDLVESSRQRAHLRAVPTNVSGVRSLVRALRAGGGTAILPDQVPPAGQGVWAPFWGQPAYTMTLLPRLVQQTGAAVLLCWCERLKGGRFRVHVSPWDPPSLRDPQATPEAMAQAMNQIVESLVRSCPEQYLWGYDRHKSPREHG
jgi:KDO2-lipid IV(A) lauroyltransferase